MNKKLANRIIGVLLIVLGLVFGGTWNPTKYCIGDKIFDAIGISPWSNGSTGTHYPGVIGLGIIVAGIIVISITLNKKARMWLWIAIALLVLMMNLLSVCI